MEAILKERIFGLDLMRAIALVLVVFSHLYYLIGSEDELLIALSGFAGFLGVEIFFALSGFLIGNMLLKLFLRDSFSIHDVVEFIKRRWFRTLPSYYLILLVNLFLMFFLHYEVSNVWKYFFFLQNFSAYEIEFYRESWSLSIEEWTYTSIPIFLFLLYQLRFKNRKFVFLIFLLFAILFFHILRFYAFPKLDLVNLDKWNVNIKSVVIYRIDAVLFGMIVSWMYFFYRNSLLNLRIVLALFALGLFVFQFAILHKYNVFLETSPIYYNVFYFTIISLICCSLLPLFIKLKTTNNLILRFVTYLSKVSYSVYLLHYSVVMVLFKYFIEINKFEINKTVLIIVYLIVTFTLSGILYKYYEKPTTDLRDKKVI